MAETVLSQKVMETQNESEKIFERYLDLNGFCSKWTYEPQIPGKKKKLEELKNKA